MSMSVLVLLLTLFLPGEGRISPLIVCHVTKSVRNRVNGLFLPISFMQRNEHFILNPKPRGSFELIVGRPLYGIKIKVSLSIIGRKLNISNHTSTP